MGKKDFYGAVNPVDFDQFVHANTFDYIRSSDFWPMAEMLIKKASPRYRTNMALSIVEHSHDLELQTKAAELLLKIVKITPDTVDDAAQTIAERFKTCPNGDELMKALQPALLEFYRRASRTSCQTADPAVTNECDMGF